MANTAGSPAIHDLMRAFVIEGKIDGQDDSQYALPYTMVTAWWLLSPASSVCWGKHESSWATCDGPAIAYPGWG